MQSELLLIRLWLPFELEDTTFLVSNIHASAMSHFPIGSLLIGY
jgi:hypothetical protein